MVRQISFRYKILRDGADLCEIYPINGGAPNISMNDSNEIKTMFMGSFINPGDAVDWLTDQIQPVLIINGAEFPLGIYLPANIRPSKAEATDTVAITAYDRGWMVRSRCTENRRYFPAGTNYISAIASVVAESGIAAISDIKTDCVLPEAREDWNIGTPNLSIVNELLAEINYKPLWFDADGTARLEPIKQPTAENIEHVLTDESIKSLMFPEFASETDIYSAPNVFICVCSNADKSAPMTAIAENTNPQSPLSIARRGRRITQVVQVNNIASLNELQAYASRLVTDSMRRGEVIDVETCLLPGFGVGDVVALKYGDLMTMCIEKSWSMDLTVGGRMHHTMERVVMNAE